MSIVGPRRELASGTEEGRYMFRAIIAQHPSEGKGLKDVDDAFLRNANVTAKIML